MQKGCTHVYYLCTHNINNNFKEKNYERTKMP